MVFAALEGICRSQMSNVFCAKFMLHMQHGFGTWRKRREHSARLRGWTLAPPSGARRDGPRRDSKDGRGLVSRSRGPDCSPARSKGSGSVRDTVGVLSAGSIVGREPEFQQREIVGKGFGALDGFGEGDGGLGTALGIARSGVQVIDELIEAEDGSIRFDEFVDTVAEEVELAERFELRPGRCRRWRRARRRPPGRGL